MDAVTAHGRFAILEDEGLTDSWPDACKLGGSWAVLGMTAAAMVSGMLPDVQDDADLVGAAQHGLSLVRMGVVSDEQFADAADEVVEALDRMFGTVGAN